MNEMFETKDIAKNKTLEDMAKLYERQEITVIFLHDRSTDSIINIFSVAEMCPYEQKKSDELFDIAPNGSRIPFKRLSLDKNRSLYITRYFSNDVIDSIRFYRGQGNKRILKIDKKDIIVGTICKSFSEEPLNEVPVLIPSYMHSETSLGAILPKQKVSMRVCSMIDVQNSTVNSFTEKELFKINKFANEVLGIDLIKYSEYIGAILLCFSNPILRSIDEKLTKSENQIIIQLFERMGKSITGGIIEISDERINGKGFVISHKIRKPKFILDIPCPPQKVRIRIFDKSGDLLEDTSSHFMKNLDIKIGIMGPKRKVNIINQDNKLDTFDIDTVSYDNNRISNEKEIDIQNLLNEKEKLRELDSLEEKRIFIYFPGNKPDSKKYAQKIIRELLGNAKERCTICDPYLSGMDVIEYALFVRHTNVQVELLSSSKYLLNKIDGQNKIYGEQLKETIDSLAGQDHTLKIKCHVLAGNKKSPLHDRFIIIDDNVYLLGSSLNEFGTRATNLFRSPDPRPLIRQADIWFDDETNSTPIDMWLVNHSSEGVVGKC